MSSSLISHAQALPTLSSKASAHSLHSLPPPEYSDNSSNIVEGSSSQDVSYDDTHLNSSTTPDFHIPGVVRAPKLNKSSEPARLRTLEPKLSNDPTTLYNLIKIQSQVPPSPSVRILGKHRETRTEINNGKTQTRTEQIMDFDITIDVTPMFSERAAKPDSANGPWHFLHCASETEKVHRGGFLKSRLHRPRARDSTHPNIESNPPEFDESNMASTETLLHWWTHHFCAAASSRWRPLVFHFHRQIHDWDTNLMSRRFEAALRATGYSGDIETTTPMQNPGFSVYSRHWMNRALHNHWIFWSFIVLQLWILAWPLLWLSTGVFDGVSTNWYYKKRLFRHNGTAQDQREMLVVYSKLSEEQFCDYWVDAVKNAAKRRHQGWIDEQDVEAVRREALQESRGGQRPATGNPAVDRAIDLFSNIHGAITEQNTTREWGSHTGQPRSSSTFNFSIRH